ARRALDVVARDDADVVPDPGRVVLPWLARTGSESVRGQADRRVRRADHPERAGPDAILDRDLELRAARVERSDHTEHGPVTRVGAGVRRALGGVPLGRLGGRVVALLVADRPLAGFEVPLRLQQEPDRIAHLSRLRPVRTLLRQIGGDQVLRTALAPV